MPLVDIREGINCVSRERVEHEYRLHCEFFKDWRERLVAWILLDGSIVFLNEELYRRIEELATQKIENQPC